MRLSAHAARRWRAGPAAIWWALVLLVCMGPGAARAQDLQPVPPLSARVIDTTRTLDATQTAALNAQLESMEQQHGTQLVVLMVGTARPEDIATYAQRVGEAWKIGRRDAGDGLLIVVAKADRQVRIEVAKGLEGAIPDVAADRIIRSTLLPAFKAGDYAGGLRQAIEALSARIAVDTAASTASGVDAGEAIPRARAAKDETEGLPAYLGLVLFIVLALAMKFGGRGARGHRAIGWGSVIGSVLMSGGLGGGRGGGSHGGFGSGGGGDFGGGGASGDW